MKKFLQRWFTKVPLVPHVCEYKCEGYCVHYGMSTQLTRAIEHPTDNHYPSAEVIQSWIDKGYDHAQVFQSHWACSCGKKLTFFFLANPNDCSQKHRQDTITQAVYDEMVTFHPLKRGASRGISMKEMTNSLCDEFCGTRKEEPYKPMFGGG